MTGLDVAVSDDGGAVKVVVAGEIDLANVERLREALECHPPPRPLTVDLSAVDYIDSAGIAVLFARAASGALEVVYRPGSAVEAVARVTSLAEVAEVRAEGT